MKRKIGIPVSEILQSESFKEFKVLTGDTGLQNLVKGVNVLEVPDALEWLREGDFILTTAYPVKGDYEKLKKFIVDLSTLKIAFVGIKVKRYIDEVPTCVIDAAKKVGLPLVIIPYEASFGDLMNDVLTSIINRQTNLLLSMNNFNNDIKDVMLRGGDLQEVAALIHQVTETPIAITDIIFNDYVVQDISGKKDDYEGITETLLSEKTEKKSYAKEYEVTQKIDVIGKEKVKRYIIPIYSTEAYYGDVYLWDKKNRISQEIIIMIEGAASLIALNFSKKLSVFENENKHKIEFIENLVSSNPLEKQKAIDKANYFKFNKTCLYRAVLVRGGEFHKDMRETPNNLKMIKQLENKMISIAKRMERLYDGDLIFANISERALFLLGFEYKSTSSYIRQRTDFFINTLLEHLKKEDLYENIKIGVGRPYSDYKMLHESYKEGLRSVQSLELSPQKHVMHYDDLGIYRILSHEEIREDVLEFAKEQLGELIEYDRTRDSDLIKTLTAYFDAGGNVKRVSENLFTHYNTVIYRMQRIKEIADIDLEDADKMLNLHIALKIMEVVKTER